MNKNLILKMAGVKTEEQFYKKYPTEAAFFKAHPKAKKMANGGEQDKGQLKKLEQLTDFGNPPIAQNGWHSEWEDDPSNPYNLQNISGAMPKNNFGNISSKDMKGIQGAVKGIMGSSNQGAASQGLAGAIGGIKGQQGGFDKFLGKAAPFVGNAMDIGEGILEIKNEKNAVHEANQNFLLSDANKQAALSSSNPALSLDEQKQRKRQYVRPEDAMIQPNQVFPTYGVGTNILTAEDGAMISGNPGEIQNTYDPNTLYDDLGYEPLEDSEEVKQYYYGGGIPKAESGFESFMTAGGGDLLGNLTSQIGSGGRGPTAGNKIGKGLGGALGTVFGGPIGGMLGGAFGSAVVGLLDSSGREINAFEEGTDRNNKSVMGINRGQGIHSQYDSVMENGGYVSNDWNPQVIAKFGDYDVEDLLSPPKDADMLRAGGHLKDYREPSDRAMQTYKDGGEITTSALNGAVKTTWGGGIKTLSYNPYMPGTGETIEFIGNSHDTYDRKSGQTGIGVKYGEGNNEYLDHATYGTKQADANVEVEKEPATELIDPVTQEKNLVVFGNLYDKVSKRKFKNHISDIAKKQNKQNKLIEKSISKLNELNVQTSFDKIEQSSLQSIIDGATMTLKDYAGEINDAAFRQSAINDTAKKYGIVADDLAKGNIKKAKLGAAIRKAQSGDEFGKATDLPGVSGEDFFYLQGLYNKAKQQKKGAAVEKFQREFSRVAPDYAKKVLSEYPTTSFGKTKGYKTDQLESNYDQIFGPRTKRYMEALELSPLTAAKLSDRKPIQPTLPKTLPGIATSKTQQEEEASPNKFPWMSVANQLIDYARPSDVENLDPNQLLGEMYALSNNQVEPVYAQKYNPQLLTPYDISLQDQLNEVTAQNNTAMRQAKGDPSALAAISAQADMAKSKILGEQFRMNQGMKNQVYNQNTNTLNDAQLKNLNILDQQAQKQSQAKSATKATIQEALNSVSSKYAQNKLENKTLGTYENLYNYRYDKSGRIRNMNPLVDFQSMIDNAKQTASTKTNVDSKGNDLLPIYDKKGNTTGYKVKETARNGSIVRALKNL